MVAEDQEHDARVIPVGSTFTGVTNDGRVIPVGQVVEIDEYFAYSHKVRWFDENGKHYEWFNLRRSCSEFKKFEIIDMPKGECNAVQTTEGR